MLQKFIPKTTLKSLACGLLAALLSITVSAAPEFEPRDMSATVLQSRTFEGVDEQQLARATLSVIQDLKFLVTETEAAPLTIVARSPGLPYGQESRTLTVSLRALLTEPDGATLRLDMVAPVPADSIWRRPPLDTRADFYQAFFAALADTLHRQGVLP